MSRREGTAKFWYNRGGSEIVKNKFEVDEKWNGGFAKLYPSFSKELNIRIFAIAFKKMREIKLLASLLVTCLL